VSSRAPISFVAQVIACDGPDLGRSALRKVLLLAGHFLAH